MPPMTTRSTRAFARKTEKTQPEINRRLRFDIIEKNRLLTRESGGFYKPRAFQLWRIGLFAIIEAARKKRIFAKER